MPSLFWRPIDGQPPVNRLASAPSGAISLGAAVLLGTLLAVPIGAQATRSPTSTAPMVQIGVADGSPAELFAVIADITVGADGGVFVLDMMQQELRSFDAGGRHRATVGRKGRGPGEFLQPNALTVTRDGLVHVVDNPNGRIATFRPTPTSLAHLHDVRLPFPVSDICAIGNRRFVMALGRPELIHELDAEGAVVRSFGDHEQPDPVVARRMAGGQSHILDQHFNQGSLACNAATGRVVMLHAATFVVRAFSLDGRPIWRVRLADVHPAEVKAIRGGTGIQIGPNEDTGIHSSGDGLAFDADGAVIVTIASMDVTRDGRRTYQERRLRAQDGAEIGRADARGVVRAIREGRRYATDGDPFPRVLIYPGPATRD